MLQQNWRALKDVSEDFKKDKEIVMQAVKQNWCALQFASEYLKKDYEIVLAAIKGNGFEFRYASDDLRKDKHLLLEAAKQRLLLLASDPQRDDVKTILLKFNYTDLVSAFVSIELKTNKAFVRGSQN
ncbi:hypothetical protein C9374_003924 [Naegleria lovaniensis]|uniref:DUF4116 domain-containing protein n=1 Tax=Naegleria lovaniensis TaxID=51637 RepID=A0AA88H059_NAELO|nr:uncharacterized protein C9374_003924 [Naegleria lovaniensis]KAG2394160.1 hypothetical protein C9374_003924 [Naegleria lovaniensis]